MKSVMFYHEKTGILHSAHLITSDDSLVELNTPDGHAAIDVIDGLRFDHLSQRVDVATGDVIDYQPPQPSAEHEWDAGTKRWHLNAAMQAKINAAATARFRIQQLDRQSIRALREYALGDESAKTRLKAIEDELVELRKTVAT